MFMANRWPVQFNKSGRFNSVTLFVEEMSIKRIICLNLSFKFIFGAICRSMCTSQRICRWFVEIVFCGQIHRANQVGQYLESIVCLLSYSSLWYSVIRCMWEWHHFLKEWNIHWSDFYICTNGHPNKLSLCNRYELNFCILQSTARLH